jgi:hypothetical protein
VIILIALAATCLLAVVATLRTMTLDGYRRSPVD